MLIADGYDSTALTAALAAMKAAGAIPQIIGPRRSKIADATGKQSTMPHHHLEGMRSTMVDALFIPGGSKSVATLSKNGRALHWIREAFGHLKAIGATGEAVELVKKAVGLPEVKVSDGGGVVESYGVVTLQHVQPDSLKDVVKIIKGAKGFLEEFFYTMAQHRNWARELEGLSTQVAY